MSVRRGAGDPRDRRGQALVELALILPMLLLLLMGIVDLARAWNIYEVITDAGREGARQAVVESAATESDIKNTIVEAGERAAIGIDPARITLTGFQSGRGNMTTVRVEYDHELKWIGPLLAISTGERVITLASEFVMRNE